MTTKQVDQPLWSLGTPFGQVIPGVTTELPTQQKGGQVRGISEFTGPDNQTKLWVAAGQEKTCKSKSTIKSGLYPRNFMA
jgi:hypothetical protein